MTDARTVETPISDFIESSPNFKAMERERDTWKKSFEDAAESGGRIIDELKARNAELEDEIEILKIKVLEVERVKRNRSIDRGKLVNGIETAIKLHEADLNPDLAFELMSTLLKGLLREVGED